MLSAVSKCSRFWNRAQKRRTSVKVSCDTLKLLRAILCVLACVLASGLRMAAWSPLAFSSSPSFFSTVAPWAATAVFPARSDWAMPANFGKSFCVSGYSLNKLKRKKTLADLGRSRSALSHRVGNWPGQNLSSVTRVVGLHGSPALQNQLMIGHRLHKPEKHTPVLK